jgi:hypothetical protein
LAGGFWTLRAVIRPSTMSPVFAESLSELVAVLYKEPCQSLILPNVRCIWWFDFWMWKTFTLGNVSWTSISYVCLMGEGQMCPVKHIWTPVYLRNHCIKMCYDALRDMFCSRN